MTCCPHISPTCLWEPCPLLPAGRNIARCHRRQQPHHSGAHAFFFLFPYIYDKKKVLLIDDSPSSEKLFNKILSGTNIELTSVKLGKEGLERIRSKEKYDLILLDEELEPQNGHIIMRKLLEIRNFNTKVILLTKDNKYDYDDSYLQEGFTDYIIKSSDKEEILNKINKYLK